MHDPLYAKAIVLSDGQRTAAWVTMDLGYADKPLTRDIRAAVSAALGFDDIFLTSSHTHSGPTFVTDFPSAADPWVLELRRKVTAAIVEAHGARQPARLGVGWGRVDLGHNRRRVRADGTVEMLWENRRGIPTSPVDRAVGVVAFDTLAGDPIATLVNLAIHPVVLGPENLDYSSDYPGAMMTWVEREVGGQAMFLQGAAGDINPFWDKTPLADGAYDRMRSMGETIGAEVSRVRSELVFADIEAIALGVERIQISPRWDIDDPAIRAGVRRDYVERFGREGEAEVKTLLIGSDLALASFPGEFFVEHGLRLKDESVVANTLFVGYSKRAPGVFPDHQGGRPGGLRGRQLDGRRGRGGRVARQPGADQPGVSLRPGEPDTVGPDGDSLSSHRCRPGPHLGRVGMRARRRQGQFAGPRRVHRDRWAAGRPPSRTGRQRAGRHRSGRCGVRRQRPHVCGRDGRLPDTAGGCATAGPGQAASRRGSRRVLRGLDTVRGQPPIRHVGAPLAGRRPGDPAADILFLRDTDGDGVADTREALFSGFPVGNTQHNINGLTWGLDNWVYAANGGNHGEGHPAGAPDVAVSIRAMDFRFRPDTGALETSYETAGGHGIAVDAWGRMFGTHNLNHVQHMVFPATYLARNPLLAVPTTRDMISDHGASAQLFQLSDAETRVNHPEQSGRFSGGSGVAFYGGGALPAAYDGNLFVNDVVVNVVHQDVLTTDGPSCVLDMLLRNRPFHSLLVGALETGDLTVGELNLDLEQRRRLLRRSSDDIQTRASALFGDHEFSNRQTVVDQWLPDVVGRRGNPDRGAEHFRTLCAQCHLFRGVGYPVGPDLGMAFTKGEEDLVTSILDPSAALAPEFANYLVETSDGELLNGIISAETASSVTLSRANGETDSVPRRRITELRTEGRSLMPDGLEQGLDAGGLADLLAYLRQHSH